VRWNNRELKEIEQLEAQLYQLKKKEEEAWKKEASQTISTKIKISEIRELSQWDITP
jgi:hypothetical protein